jgi:hypothetical protein
MYNKSILSISLFIILSLSMISISGCSDDAPVELPSRESRIPSDAVKMTPDSDRAPLELHSDDFYAPVPVQGSVNSAGAEDSPFIMPDGNTLYFFFTPDVRVPVEKQLLDGVTGIYVSKKTGDSWGAPERVLLQKSGKLALDGCEFVQDDIMWFCSAREGYTGIHWFTAEFKDGAWKDFKEADFDPEYKVGELHFSRDWNKVYFHSDRPGGKGGLDIWMSEKVDGKWQAPINIEAVNSADSEGWPALSPDETELWLLKNYGIWRSKLIGDGWSAPELIVSPLAGEPSLDSAGNVYFVHHFFEGDKMIEADIYVAKRK